MIALLIVTLAAGDPPAGTEPSPSASSAATQLTLNVTKVLAPRTDRVALAFDGSLESRAADEIREAFARSGLFTLDPSAAQRAIFRRDTDTHVTVAVFDNAEPLDEFATRWPKGPSSRELKGKLDGERLTLRRASQLELENVQTDYPSGFDPYLSPNVKRGPEAGFRAPSVSGESWEVVDGKGVVLDDIALARRLGDAVLEAELSERRARRRRIWSWGFGTAAVASAGAGAAVLLSADGSSDREVLGLSLLGAGVVSGVIALLNDSVDEKHLLSVEQAAELVRVHNQRLAEHEESQRE